MKTMKRFASRLCAVLLVLTVGVTALVPAAFAAKAQLPSLPSDQCVVDDANVLSNSTTTTIENLNAQLTEQCSGAQIGVLTVEYTGSVSTEDNAVCGRRLLSGDRRRLPQHHTGKTGQRHCADHGGQLCGRRL